MAISFPPSPQADGTTYSYNGVTYVYALASDQWIVQGTGSSDLYVLKTGDTMTGSLTTVGYSGTTGTFSGDLSGAGATFSGRVTSGDFVDSEVSWTGGGVTIYDDGIIYAGRGGSSNLWVGRQSGTAAATSTIKADGTAAFISADTATAGVNMTRWSRTLTEGQSVFLRIDGNSSVRQGSTTMGVRWSDGADAPCGYINLPRWSNNSARYYWTDSSQNLMSSSTANHVGTNSGVVIGTQTSDIRLKRNIGDFAKGLAEVKQLEAMSFEYLSEPGVPQAGFIAQQVKDIIPEAVYDTNEPVAGDEDGPTMLAMDYVKIIPVLVNAIKELDAKNTALEAQLSQLTTTGGASS